MSGRAAPAGGLVGGFFERIQRLKAAAARIIGVGRPPD